MFALGKETHTLRCDQPKLRFSQFLSFKTLRGRLVLTIGPGFEKAVDFSVQWLRELSEKEKKECSLKKISI
jgi:hypothetical protein